MCLKHAGCFLIVVKLEINGPRRLEVMFKKVNLCRTPCNHVFGTRENIRFNGFSRFNSDVTKLQAPYLDHTIVMKDPVWKISVSTRLGKGSACELLVFTWFLQPCTTVTTSAAIFLTIIGIKIMLEPVDSWFFSPWKDSMEDRKSTVLFCHFSIKNRWNIGVKIAPCHAQFWARVVRDPAQFCGQKTVW